MSHGYVDEWWERYKLASPEEQEKMWAERKQARREFDKKYAGWSPLAIECDMILKGEGIYGAVRGIVGMVEKYGDDAVVLFEKVFQE